MYINEIILLSVLRYQAESSQTFTYATQDETSASASQISILNGTHSLKVLLLWPAFHVADKDITEQHLTLIRWKNEHGNQQTLKLIEEMSGKWTTIGSLIGIGTKLDNYAKKHGSDPEPCMREVVKEWIMMCSKKVSHWFLTPTAR